MEELEFKRLIRRYQQGLLSGEKKALLDEWFEALGKDENPESWTKGDKIRLKHKILRQISAHREPDLSGRRFWRITFRAAASVLLLATLSYTVWQSTRTGEQKEMATLQVSASGNTNKLVLDDGSIVWLKGNSTLTYPENFSGKKRQVTLQGEALFEVVKDTLRPFIIQCGGLITTVLGTSFNIKSSDQNIEVVVLTGKVSLTSENDKHGLIVLPNEKAVYKLGEKKIAKVAEAIAKEETKATVAGTEYSMYFEDTRMEEVIHRIEGKFNVTIETPDPKLGNCMITADFTGQSLERTLDMIGQALGIDYEIKDRAVVLLGAGCN